MTQPELTRRAAALLRELAKDCPDGWTPHPFLLAAPTNPVRRATEELVDAGLLEKREDGAIRLSDQGRRFLGAMTSDDHGGGEAS